jgi:hypothetical protein
MMARTVDKLRAELPGGVSGEFHYNGFSERLLNDLGIAHDDLLAIVATADSDDEIAAWIMAKSDTGKYATLNEQMLSRKLDDTNREHLTKKYPVLLEHPDISLLFDLIDADDAAIFGDKTAVK